VDEMYIEANSTRIPIACTHKQRIRVAYDEPRRILAYRCDEADFQLLYLGHEHRWAPHCEKAAGNGAFPKLEGLRTWNLEAEVLYRCGNQATVIEELRNLQGETRVAEFLQTAIDVPPKEEDFTDVWVHEVAHLSADARNEVILAVCKQTIAETCKTLGDHAQITPDARRIRVCPFSEERDAAPCAEAALRLAPRMTSLVSANLMADLLVLSASSKTAGDAACSVVTSGRGPIETLETAAWMTLGLEGRRCGEPVGSTINGFACDTDFDCEGPEPNATHHLCTRAELDGLRTQWMHQVRNPGSLTVTQENKVQTESDLWRIVALKAPSKARMQLYAQYGTGALPEDFVVRNARRNYKGVSSSMSPDALSWCDGKDAGSPCKLQWDDNHCKDVAVPEHPNQSRHGRALFTWDDKNKQLLSVLATCSHVGQACADDTECCAEVPTCSVTHPRTCGVRATLDAGLSKK
jgi:hypothetical protein